MHFSLTFRKYEISSILDVPKLTYCIPILLPPDTLYLVYIESSLHVTSRVFIKVLLSITTPEFLPICSARTALIVFLNKLKEKIQFTVPETSLVKKL